MSIRPILRWPDPRLSTVCAPVEDPATVEALVLDLFETMYAAPGRGIAAPQVGECLRLFVMDAGWKQGEMTPLACLNPRFVQMSEAQAVGPEGCLSVPGVTAEVPRSAEVEMAFTDLGGQAQQVRLSGAAAVIAQHEMDHLDGVMHFDRLDPQARTALLAVYDAVP